MKYIRTKDGRILKILDEDYKYFYVGYPCDIGFRLLEKRQNDILKQANTIEELCDEYVVYAEDYGYFNPTEIVHRHWVFDHIEEVKEQIKLIGAGIKRIIYGAIWTDKGLIYVAKMNDKGCLELL